MIYCFLYVAANECLSERLLIYKSRVAKSEIILNLNREIILYKDYIRLFFTFRSFQNALVVGVCYWASASLITHSKNLVL